MGRERSLEATGGRGMSREDRFLQMECVRRMVEESKGREVLVLGRSGWHTAFVAVAHRSEGQMEATS